MSGSKCPSMLSHSHWSEIGFTVVFKVEVQLTFLEFSIPNFPHHYLLDHFSLPQQFVIIPVRQLLSEYIRTYF